MRMENVWQQIAIRRHVQKLTAQKAVSIRVGAYLREYQLDDPF